MKKLFITAGLVLFVIVTKAQQPPAPPPLEERLKHATDIIQKEVKPTAAQKAAIENAFKSFLTAADKLRKDNPPPPPDPKVKEAMDKLVKERDEAIKKILTADQYEKYKDAAKKLHPPKPGDKGGNKPPPPPSEQ